METLYTVRFKEVSGFSSFKNFKNQTTGCGDIAYSPMGYFTLSHPVYADDIALLAGSCYGLQKMLDICTEYGHTWNITFNPTKSQLLTMGRKNPPVSLTLAHKSLAWYNSVKYIGMHLISGKNFKSAKLKYYECFNSILSVTGKRQDEIICLNLVSTYCLPCTLGSRYHKT